MALQQLIIHDVRLVGPTEFSAYIKVSNVAGSKEDMAAEVRYLKDSASGDLIKVESYSFGPDMDGDNFIKQAYEHLKTLPEFEGAIDC
jgi:hypothetical protein